MAVELVPAIALPSLLVSDDEKDLLNRYERELTLHRSANLLKKSYYDGRARLRDLGISIPPQLLNIETVVGWPNTAVTSLSDRLDFQGWVSPDEDLDLSQVFRDNDLDVESHLGNEDALLYGTAYIGVSTGFDGEPDPLVTIESPMTTIGSYDRRIRRLSSAVAFDYDDDGLQVARATLYMPNETIKVIKRHGTWFLDPDVDRDQHNMGRVSLARVVNRPTGADRRGHSEITPSVRSYTDQAVRTLVRAEVGAEFYSAPQRYALGVDEAAFTDEDGNKLPAWQAYMGRILALQPDEDADKAQLGQFSAASMTPHFEQIRNLGQMLASDLGVPVSYLGQNSDSPPSADAIRAGEARLVKRAERRQATFGVAWTEVARLCLLHRDGELPDNFGSVRPLWRDAATPTRSAAADETVKLVAAGVLPADSRVVLERIGLSESDISRVESDRRRSSINSLVAGLPTATADARQDATVVALADRRAGAAPAENPAELKSKADALGALIRAGVSAESAAARVGLTGLEFTGAVPVSLRLPESDAADLEEG